VGPNDQIQVLVLQKGLHNVRPKDVGNPPIVFCPSLSRQKTRDKQTRKRKQKIVGAQKKKNC
jgi:hypothetical protein